MKDLILAIDQGTSGTKALVFDPAGRALAKATGSLATSFPQPGFVEQDPYAIQDDVLATARACLAALPSSGRAVADLAAIGLSNQRETFVLWDHAGRPLCNAVVWQCKRSIGICEELRASGAEAIIKQRTGLIADPYFSGSKVAWLRRNDAAVRAAIDAGLARFGTVDSWLLYCLTGGGAYRTDYTNASRTLFFDLARLRWDEELLACLGLSGLLLPEALPSSAAFGATDLGGLLPSPLPVAAMIGDSHAAAVGQGLFVPGAAKATLGTGSSLLMNVGPNPVASGKGLMSTLCFTTRGRADYALEGIIVSCGSPVKWLRDSLGLFADAAEAEALARSVPDSGGVALVPAFSGMAAPYWQMDARGALCGLTFGTTKAHIARAALEAAAFQVADVLAVMQEEGSIALAGLRLDGGMSANSFVTQLIADLVGERVEALGLAEASAFGAARLAAVGVGLVAEPEDFGAATTGRSDPGTSSRAYEPGAGRVAALEAYGAWKLAVDKIL